MRMAFFMRNLLKSFSSMRISSSVRIFLNLFFCENFLKSSLSGRISSFYENILIFFICENRFLFLENFFCSLFLSLYENKPIYECHLLNLQIFKNKHLYVPRSCFLACILLILCLSFFLLNKVSLTNVCCDIHPFCRIRFFTINIFHRMRL